MASSNTTIDPWMFKPTLPDSWYPNDFAIETESALTKALQQSFFTNQHQSLINQTIPISSPFLINQTDYSTTTTITTTVSGSGSEPETPGSKRRGTHLGKRKSRASKRSMTTFIQADPSNFRQMVQQVTGVKWEGNGQLPVVKPEPLRQPFVNKVQGVLPTLDTSAYLLHRPVSTSNQLYSFSGFPTLESSF